MVEVGGVVNTSKAKLGKTILAFALIYADLLDIQ